MDVKSYWESENVKSMSDPRITRLESHIIAKHISEEDNILDVGCGDGSGSFLYRYKCKSYTGIDRSSTMLSRFNHPNLHQIDISTLPDIGTFSAIVFQRCLINLEEDQYKVLSHFSKFTDKIILCEAFQDGFDKVNELRGIVGCKEIKPRWHNTYLTNEKVKSCLHNFNLIVEEDLSVYFLLTRVLHAGLTDNPDTNSKINEFAELLQYNLLEIKGLSTIKIQIWEKY